MSPDSAETTALNALGWLVADDELLPIFMGATGVDQNDIRNNAGDAAFLGSVIDFLLMDDAWVIRVCDALSIPYSDLATARQALPGGAQIHWT